MVYEGKRFRKIEIDTEKEVFLIDGEDITDNCEWLQITFDGGKVTYESRMFGQSFFSDLREYLDDNAEREKRKTAEENRKAIRAAFIEAFNLYGKLGKLKDAPNGSSNDSDKNGENRR